MKSDVESVHSSQCSSGSAISNATNVSSRGSNKQKSQRSKHTPSHVSIVESDPNVHLLRPSSGPFRTNIFIPGPVVVTNISHPLVDANTADSGDTLGIPFEPEITTFEVETSFILPILSVHNTKPATRSRTK